MRLRLHKLQAKDKQARKLKVNQQPSQQGWKNIDNVLHHQGLSYVSKIIQTKLINRHHNNPLAGHFRIEKIQELVLRKYYWLTLCRDVEDYVRGCDVCLASKAVRHKLYGNLQSLSVLTHHWKDLSMDFVTGLPILTDWKGNSYDSILVIINRLMKMIHYKLVKVPLTPRALMRSSLTWL